jgi:hypothetical protein
MSRLATRAHSLNLKEMSTSTKERKVKNLQTGSNFYNERRRNLFKMPMIAVE